MSSKYLLQSLFIETHRGGIAPPRYTLKQRDHKGYPSLYRLFMEMEDATEYDFATSYLDGYDHWLTLCECTWFKPLVSKWRQHLEMKIKAKALFRLKEMAELEGKEKLPANKALLEYEKYLSRPLPKNKVGRPSKEKLSKLDIDSTLSSIMRDINKQEIKETIN